MTEGRKKNPTRSSVGLSTLDSFLNDQGKLEEFQTVAIDEVHVWQNKGSIPPAVINRDPRD